VKKDIIGKLFCKFEALTIKAKDFADELTSHNIMKRSLTQKIQIVQEYRANNKAVCDMLLKRGVKP
jgi:DNA-damage-inducible protein D